MKVPLKKLYISSDDYLQNNAEAWNKWWQQLELNLLASGLDKSHKNRKLNCIAHWNKALEIFNNFNLRIDNSTLEVKKIFKNFSSHIKK